jgi:hypothetical protein
MVADTAARTSFSAGFLKLERLSLRRSSCTEVFLRTLAAAHLRP